jgi:hypothetical protein
MLQQMIKMLTVGALGNDSAAPGMAVFAAASSAVSGRSKLRMSASHESWFESDIAASLGIGQTHFQREANCDNMIAERFRRGNLAGQTATPLVPAKAGTRRKQ